MGLDYTAFCCVVARLFFSVWPSIDGTEDNPGERARGVNPGMPMAKLSAAL